MGFWTALLLIFKNIKYVVQLLQILQSAAEKGYNAYDLQRGLNRLKDGFKDVKTIEDTANSAGSINDSFRK